MDCRALSLRDATRLLSFYTSLSPAVTDTYQPFRDPDLEAMHHHLEGVEKGDHISFCLEDDGEIVGHSFVINIRQKDPVFGIGVKERYHGRGLGRRLMSWVLAEASLEGIEHVTLTVLKYNSRALSLYRSFGFRVISDHTFRDKDDSFFMVRDARRRVYKLGFFVPESHLESVKEELFRSGAGRYAKYDKCSWQTAGTGQFRPLEGADPALGTVGKLEKTPEYRVEMICTEEHLSEVVQSLRESHPYEEPAFDIVEIVQR